MDAHSGHIGGALLLVAGVAFALVAMRNLVARRRRIARFLRAEGRVVEVENRDDPVFLGELYVMLVSFRTASGEETILRFSRRDGRVPRIGDPIPILYPAEAPSMGEAEGPSSLGRVGTIALALLLATLGVVLLWVSTVSGDLR